MSAYGVKAKRTKYRGRTYRSKTEALWAMALTRAGLTYAYEVKTAGVFYLPDFLVGNCYVEVKPAKWVGYPTIPHEWMQKATALVAKTGVPLLMVFGEPGARVDVLRVTKASKTGIVTLDLIEHMGTRGIFRYLRQQSG